MDIRGDRLIAGLPPYSQMACSPRFTISTADFDMPFFLLIKFRFSLPA